jgi:hypothetical protein
VDSYFHSSTGFWAFSKTGRNSLVTMVALCHFIIARFHRLPTAEVGGYFVRKLLSRNSERYSARLVRPWNHFAICRRNLNEHMRFGSPEFPFVAVVISLGYVPSVLARRGGISH